MDATFDDVMTTRACISMATSVGSGCTPRFASQCVGDADTAASPSAPASCMTTTPTADLKQLVGVTALLLDNAGSRGDTDVLPRSSEYRVLRGYSHQIAREVWSVEQEASVEIVEVPLSRLTARDVHSVDAYSFLRFGGAVLAMARLIEKHRAHPSVATAVRWAPNRSRCRLVEPGSFQRWDASLAQIEASFPFVLELDMALFFPSLAADVVHRALARWTPAGADLVNRELQRLRIRGLPVGGIPARLLGEAVLHDVDRALLDAGRKHVRRMDDMTIGVRDEQDADAVRRLVAAVVRPHLHLSKSKARLRPSRSLGFPPQDPTHTVRQLLGDADPDRVRLGTALRELRDLIPAWETRRRVRWLRLLAAAVGQLPVSVGAVLRTLGRLVPGTPGLSPSDLEAVRNLLAAPVALHRAQVALFLSRVDPAGAPILARAARLDASPLVRREALMGLVRLGARSEVAQLLKGQPETTADHPAWVIASAVFGHASPLADRTTYLKILHRAAGEHRPHEV